jgi:hypothetical protein
MSVAVVTVAFTSLSYLSSIIVLPLSDSLVAASLLFLGFLSLASSRRFRHQLMSID